MGKMPLIAIVGRANVGKSSIFNRLVSQRQAIVADEPGTTRDAVYGRIITPEGVFGLVDTAGLKAPEDQFEASIQEQIADASSSAALIIVVVDGTVMLTDEDRRVIRLARKSGSPIILAVNKSEGKKVNIDSYHRLGVKNVVLTSASQGSGFSELLEIISSNVKPVKHSGSGGLTIALIGRPNVGKSSLFNALAKRQQAIVADKAGTTRDVNRISLNYHGQPLTLLDTAGIRRSGKVEKGIERFSVMRAVSAIEESDICILVIDATEPAVAVEQKLAGAIKEAGKGLVLVPTKWDLVDKDAFTHDELLARLRREFQFVPWARFSVASSLSGQNVARLLEICAEIHEQRQRKLKTSELNAWLASSVASHPPAGLKNAHPKLRYVTQTGENPPEFTVFGSHTRLLHWSYHRYMERQLREKFGFAGTPVKILFREKE